MDMQQETVVFRPLGCYLHSDSLAAVSGPPCQTLLPNNSFAVSNLILIVLLYSNTPESGRFWILYYSDTPVQTGSLLKGLNQVR